MHLSTHSPQVPLTAGQEPGLLSQIRSIDGVVNSETSILLSSALL